VQVWVNESEIQKSYLARSVSGGMPHDFSPKPFVTLTQSRFGFSVAAALHLRAVYCSRSSPTIRFTVDRPTK
jgi:hypothetical protein